MRLILRLFVGYAALVALTNFGAAAEPANEFNLTGLSEEIEATRQDWGVPGVAVAVVSRDHILHASGHGVRALNAPAPVDADTIFLINSMTKSFTGLLGLRLQETGKLQLTDPIVDHLSWFRLADPAVTMQATLEDAIVHRIGLHLSDMLEDVSGMNAKEEVRRLRFFRQDLPFRTTYRYDSTPIEAAGLAMGGEKGWDVALREMVLQPLGLTRTIPDIRSIIRVDQHALCHECEPTTTPLGEAAVIGLTNVASPHVLSGNRIVLGHWRAHPSPASANAASSANDMARYLQAILAGAGGKAGAVLSQPLVDDLLTPRIPQNDRTVWVNAPEMAEQTKRIRQYFNSSYALGWECTVYAGERLCQHAGASLGFLSLMAILPDRGLGFVVLTNYRHHNSWGMSDALGMRLLDRLVANPPVDWSAFFKSQIQSELAAEAAAHEEARKALLPFRPALSPPSAIAGRYAHDALGTAQVTADRRSGLLIDFGPQRNATAKHVSANTYEMRWNAPRNSPQLVGFEIDAKGSVAAMILNGEKFNRVD